MYRLVKPWIDGQEPSYVKRLSDNAIIPFSAANSDYQDYLRWLDGYEVVGEGWVKTSEKNLPQPAEG